MKNKRPVFLNLMAMRFPITAIVSILHRISGFLLFLAIPSLLYILQETLSSPEKYTFWVSFGHNPIIKWTFAILGLGLVYHIIAGVRHIIMDFGFGEGACAMRAGAYLVLLLTAIAAIGLGVVLW